MTWSWKNSLEKSERLSEKSIHNFSDFDYASNYRVRANNLETILLFLEISKTFEFIHREEMEQILLAYTHFKETAQVITMLYLYHSHDMAMCETYIECP